MHIPWEDCELFVSVADTGSFSGAARRLRMTQPTVSRRIAALEDLLGRPLFRRDRGGAHLTDEGATLLPSARQMARWAAEMDRAAASWESDPEGTVRIAAPPGVAFELLVPFAAELKKTLPGLSLEIIAGVEHLDLTRGEADLAIRTRLPTQAELVVLHTLPVAIGVFAAPSLVGGACGPVRAADLPWVTFGFPLEHVSPRPELEAFCDPLKIGLASNDYLVQRRAVEAGLGAMVLPRDQSHPYLPWQELVELETDLPIPETFEMHLVCARSMRHVPRVRAVAERFVASVAPGSTTRA